MIQQCNTCRFWLFAEDGGDDDGGRPYGWGWCRRSPPQLSERMSGMLIPSLGNRSDNYDPEDVATVQRVSDSSLFPATWHDKWCGDFEPAPSPRADWDAALADMQEKKAAWDRWCAEDNNDLAVPACDAWAAAQDHLVEKVRAPDAEALVAKFEMARERWDGFTIPDEWLDAFAADALTLAGKAA